MSEMARVVGSSGSNVELEDDWRSRVEAKVDIACRSFGFANTGPAVIILTRRKRKTRVSKELNLWAPSFK